MTDGVHETSQYYNLKSWTKASSEYTGKDEDRDKGSN